MYLNNVCLNSRAYLWCFSGAVADGVSEGRGFEGRVVSSAGRCFLSFIWQSSLHHCSPAAAQHWVPTHTRPLIVCYRGLCLVCVWLIWYFCVFRSLVLLSEWRAVVSELIGLCYRMSDVVSPVVQSSSPEGLIPMDTESGKCI